MWLVRSDYSAYTVLQFVMDISHLALLCDGEHLKVVCKEDAGLGDYIGN